MKRPEPKPMYHNKIRFTRSQILRLAPLLLCTTAGATPAIVNEANTTNVWTLPTGNLISGATASPSVPNTSDHGNGDITSNTWATITDGSVGVASTKTDSVAPNNNEQVVFPLDTSTATNGYVITQLDTYSAWPDAGRINQNYVVEYAKASDPFTYLPLVNVTNNSGGSNVATHSKVTDSTGTLATNVVSIRFTFPNQQNGYVGYREFVVQGTAIPVSNPLTWSGTSGSGGNATWVTTADSNWKLTSTGVTAPYSPIANLTFDSSGANRNITVPNSLSTAAISLANTTATPYTIGGTGTITVNGDITANNGGAFTVNAPFAVPASSLVASGSGTLAFGSTFQAKDLLLSGGSLKFAGATASVGSLTGFAGSVALGSASPVVNTVLTVTNSALNEYDGSITSVTGAKGGLTKAGAGVLLLTGANNYTGVTTVTGGQLDFASPASLYNGASASWTAANLLVSPGASLTVRAGVDGEFTQADILNIKTGGIQAGGYLGIDTDQVDFTLTSPLTGSQGLLKYGAGNNLFLKAVNTYTGDTRIIDGAIDAGCTTGASIPGNVTMGDGTGNGRPFLNFSADNQLSAGTVINQMNGDIDAKVQLRGTTQTVQGLDSAPTSTHSIIQNDESGTPGYVGTIKPATLNIHATTNHSWTGLIRDGDAATAPNSTALTINKTGAGTQEFINVAAQSDNATGGLNINEGAVKINFSGGSTGWGAPVHIASGANFYLDGTFTWGMIIDGAGHVAKQGAGTVTKVSTTDAYTGGTTIEAGTLILAGNGVVGEGTAANEPGSLGTKSASNPVIVSSGATLMFNSDAVLGNSFMLPQFGYVITVNGGTISGGTAGKLTFLPNVTLNGGKIDVTNGGNAGDNGGFGTCFGLVGTLIVTGTTPSSITTSGTGAYANVTLGDLGAIGTTFQVADVTGNASDDLVVGSILRDVQANPSPLTKMGPGTMHLSAMSTYTGATNVNEGTLIVDQPYFADASAVSIGTSATLSLNYTGSDTVATLTIGGTPMAAGTYGSTANTTAGVIKNSHITGTGTLVVTSTGSTTTGYDAFAAQIPDTTQRDRTADPDHDGYSNLTEYLFGSSPVTANGSLILSTATSTGIVVRWNQLTTPGTSTYTLQESADLVTWTTSTATVSNDPATGPTGYTVKQATIPFSSGKRFVRVLAAE